MSRKLVDAVVLMFGTNDLKTRFNIPASDIATVAGTLWDTILKSDCGPEAIIRSPC